MLMSFLSCVAASRYNLFIYAFHRPNKVRKTPLKYVFFKRHSIASVQTDYILLAIKICFCFRNLQV